MRSRAFLLFILLSGGLLAVSSAWATSTPFERPAALEPDIKFWRRVYTEIGTSQGFIHDNARLDIVYTTVNLRAGESNRQRQQRIDREKSEIRAGLLSLATGKRQGLSAREQRLLDLWGKDTGAAELRQAADRLRFQLGQSDKFRDGLIRSGRWDAYIRKTFADMGLPEELVALPHVESSYHPGARSNVGATGMWQFTRSTGRRFMRVDHVVDERLDPFLATVAAGQLLAQNLAVTGTWPLALTAYNHGAASLRRAKAQLGTTDIDTIVRNYRGRAFGFASRNFYVAFLAALDISRDPERYFGRLDLSPPDTSQAIKLPGYFSIPTLAEALGVDESTLRTHNPALLDPVWRGEKHVPRDYSLRLPATTASLALARLDRVPDNERFTSQTPDLYHKVRRGDTLSGIAAYYRIGVNSLVAMNNLRDRHSIRAGQVLVLPGGAKEQAPTALVPTVAAVAPAPAAQLQLPDTIPPVAAVEAVAEATDESAESQDTVVASEESIVASTESIGQLVEVAEPLTADPSDYSVAADGSIRIQAEETLGHYAEWLGLRASQLRHLNNMRYKTPLVVGKRLKLEFSQVSQPNFEARRLAFHQDIQTRFFSQFKIVGTRSHQVKPGESFWVLSQGNPGVPLWLLYQFNPDLDLARIRAGATVAVPVLEEST